jgi:hypothetical protein
MVINHGPLEYRWAKFFGCQVQSIIDVSVTITIIRIRSSTKLMLPLNIIRRKIDTKWFPNDPSKAITGVFYHGIILSGDYGWFAALNLLESGMLQTPNYIAHWDTGFAKSHRSVRDREIGELKFGGDASGGLTPMSMHYIYAAIGIRLGLHPQKGAVRLTYEQEANILKRSKIEIKFEMERRRIARNAASRLDCLYVADNKDTIKRLFNDHPDLLILKVKIAEALRFTKADTQWFEEYYKTECKKCIKKYWTSRKYEDNVNSWEYLVDGLIVVDDPSGLEYVRSIKLEEDERLKQIE